jgi:hypothetical protein
MAAVKPTRFINENNVQKHLSASMTLRNKLKLLFRCSRAPSIHRRLRMLHLLIGCLKFKMATDKPEVFKSQLLDYVAEKFQRLIPPLSRSKN